MVVDLFQVPHLRRSQVIQAATIHYVVLRRRSASCIIRCSFPPGPEGMRLQVSAPKKVWVLVATRLFVGCLVSLSMGGCAELVNEPTHYAASSVAKVDDGSLQLPETPLSLKAAQSLEAPRSREAPHSGRQPSVTNPQNILEKSVHESATWEQIDPTDQKVPRASSGSHPRDYKTSNNWGPTTTNSLNDAEAAGGPAQKKSGSYNRRATMDQLVKDGKDAIKGICSGC